jgi:hypothetical protein
VQLSHHAGDVRVGAVAIARAGHTLGHADLGPFDRGAQLAVVEVEQPAHRRDAVLLLERLHQWEVAAGYRVELERELRTLDGALLREGRVGAQLRPHCRRV